MPLKLEAQQKFSFSILMLNHLQLVCGCRKDIELYHEVGRFLPLLGDATGKVCVNNNLLLHVCPTGV